YPKNDGIPPCARIYRSAIVFNCVPVTPGRTARTTSRKASAASTPASRICWISAGVFTIIIALRVAIAFRAGSRMLLPRASACLEDLHQPAMHALDVTVANGLKQSTAPVELHQRFGLPMIRLKAPPPRSRLVEAVLDDGDHHVIRDQFALIDVLSGLLPERGLRRHRRAQDVPGADLRDALGLLEELRLRALARAWRPQKDEVHLPHE